MSNNLEVKKIFQVNTKPALQEIFLFVVLNKLQSASEVLHKFLNRKKLVLDVSFCHVIYVLEIGEVSDGNIQVTRC